MDCVEQVPVDLGMSCREFAELPEETRFKTLRTRLIEAAARERSLSPRDIILRKLSYLKSKTEMVTLSSGAHVGVWLQGMTSKTLQLVLTPSPSSADACDDSPGGDDYDMTDEMDEDELDEDEPDEDEPIEEPRGTYSRGMRFDDDNPGATHGVDHDLPSDDPAVVYGDEHAKMEDRMRSFQVPANSASTKSSSTQPLWDRYGQLKPAQKSEIIDAALRVEYTSHSAMPALYEHRSTRTRLADPPKYDFVRDPDVPPLTSRGTMEWYGSQPKVHGLKVAFPGYDFTLKSVRRSRYLPEHETPNGLDEENGSTSAPAGAARAAPDGSAPDGSAPDRSAPDGSARAEAARAEAARAEAAPAEATPTSEGPSTSPPIDQGATAQQAMSQMQNQLNTMVQVMQQQQLFQMQLMSQLGQSVTTASNTQSLPPGWNSAWSSEYHYYYSVQGLTQWHFPGRTTTGG